MSEMLIPFVQTHAIILRTCFIKKNSYYFSVLLYLWSRAPSSHIKRDATQERIEKTDFKNVYFPFTRMYYWIDQIPASFYASDVTRINKIVRCSY